MEFAREYTTVVMIKSQERSDLTDIATRQSMLFLNGIEHCTFRDNDNKEHGTFLRS